MACLGILPCHPLWREVQRAIMEHGGSYVALVSDISAVSSGLARQHVCHLAAAGVTIPRAQQHRPTVIRRRHVRVG